MVLMLSKINSNRGQYNDAVLDELESQNDSQVEGMSAKVRMLKDVRCSLLAPRKPARWCMFSPPSILFAGTILFATFRSRADLLH